MGYHLFNTSILMPEPWLFFKTHGSDAVGWFNMSMFFVMFLCLLIWAYYSRFASVDVIVSFLLQPLALGSAYMLMAQNQFYMLRPDGVHINALLLVVNSVMWYTTVICTGSRVITTTPRVIRELVNSLALFAPILLFAGAISWGSARYGCFVIGSLTVLCTVLLTLIRGNAMRFSFYTETRHLLWFLFALFFSTLYLILMLLGHAYDDVVSLSGSVAASGITNFCALVFQIVAHRRLERTPVIISFDDSTIQHPIDEHGSNNSVTLSTALSSEPH